ncbi:hypothetical protein BD410DRAFT_807396 [Rickenella mellea]|uniref:Uncharacterized protein n=1 Tax=Rickenella mellea TaxID=50990 RepID=A0A4Y7PQQ5_9AGAM|nr:hypothetical protein BD410DRAFT_807396 [Rickenella mellea]
MLWTTVEMLYRVGRLDQNKSSMYRADISERLGFFWRKGKEKMGGWMDGWMDGWMMETEDIVYGNEDAHSGVEVPTWLSHLRLSDISGWCSTIHAFEPRKSNPPHYLSIAVLPKQPRPAVAYSEYMTTGRDWILFSVLHRLLSAISSFIRQADDPVMVCGTHGNGYHQSITRRDHCAPTWAIPHLCVLFECGNLCRSPPTSRLIDVDPYRVSFIPHRPLSLFTSIWTIKGHNTERTASRRMWRTNTNIVPQHHLDLSSNVPWCRDWATIIRRSTINVTPNVRPGDLIVSYSSFPF